MGVCKLIHEFKRRQIICVKGHAWRAPPSC